MSLLHSDITLRAARPRAARLMRLATYASVGVAATLISVKLGALYATGAAVILATLIDSILDGAASLLNLLAVRHSLQPADSEHRFGHGKAEALAGLGQAAFIGGSAVFLGFESVQRILDPQRFRLMVNGQIQGARESRRHLGSEYDRRIEGNRFEDIAHDRL